MSIYRDTNASIVFEHPHPGPLTAVVYRNDTEIASAPDLIPLEGRFTLKLTYKETQFDGPLRVEWIAEDFLRVQHVEVRNAIIPLSRLKTAFDDEHWPQGDLEELENNVRLLIEAYTRQKFTFEIGSKRIVGTGEDRLALPMRLNKLISVSSAGPASYFSVSNDGWSLMVKNKNWMTIKEAPPEEFEGNQVWTGAKGVIHVPDLYWRQFRAGTSYTVEGEWGYPSVPEDVQEAAMLLASDFGSCENSYRDRYLEAIKSGDWNLVYNEGAYRGTGNARADQLLNKYRRHGMVII